MTKKKPESLTKKQQEAIAKAEKEKAKKSATKTKAEKPAEKKSTAKAATKTKQDKKPIEKSVKPVVKAKTKAKVAPKKEVEKKAPKKPAFDRDEVFPEVLEIDDATYTRTELTYDEICERYEDGENTFIALESDSNYLKNYKNWYDVNPPKNAKGKAEFPDNLDFLQVILVQSATEQILTVSVHTEAVLRFQKSQFKMDKDGYCKAGDYKFNLYVEDDGE